MSTGLQPADSNIEANQPRRIARVLPLLGIAHLDRLFDYEVPEEISELAVPGTRVRIRFAGRLVDGFIIERRRTTDHPGQLTRIKRLISPVQVLPKRMWNLVNTLSERSAGTRSDILRSAIPPRHANAERAGLFAGGKSWEDLHESLTPIEQLTDESRTAADSVLAKYRFGERFLAALLDKDAAPKMSLLTVPGDDETSIAAALAAATAWSGHGALIIAPNNKVVNRVTSSLRTWLSESQILEMTATESSHVRYRRFLSIVQGQARVVVGTRSAAFAPVNDLKLVILLGEADDSLVDPRAPYLHARAVAKLRTDLEECGFAVIGPHRSAEVQLWVEQKQLASIQAEKEELQARLPWIRGLGDTEWEMEKEVHSPGSRLPSVAFEAIRAALDADAPALIQVPRRGYAPALACASCRTPARCRVCNGPLELPAGTEFGVPTCRWCGHIHSHFTCANCGNHSVRMTVVGHDRTAEEVGRAFPGVAISLSGGDQVKESVPSGRRIVVATPGAEPIVNSGEHRTPDSPGLYGALVLLDPWISLTRADLRAEETSLRQWMTAAAMVRSRDSGGRVIVAGDANHHVVQQLILWNPARSAQRELAQRKEAAFPPAVVVAAIDGTVASIAELEDVWELPPSAELLGPVELPSGVRLPPGLDSSHAREARRLIIRVPHDDGDKLGVALKAAAAVRTSLRHSAPLRIVMDPVRIG